MQYFGGMWFLKKYKTILFAYSSQSKHSLWFSGIEKKLELTWKSEYDAFLWSAAGNEMFAMKPGDIGIRVFSGILE